MKPEGLIVIGFLAESFDELAEYGHGFGELVELHPFIHSVRLKDAPGTDNDQFHELSKHGSIGAVRDRTSVVLSRNLKRGAYNFRFTGSNHWLGGSAEHKLQSVFFSGFPHAIYPFLRVLSGHRTIIYSAYTKWWRDVWSAIAVVDCDVPVCEGGSNSLLKYFESVAKV